MIHSHPSFVLGGAFLATHNAERIPPLVGLPRLLSAAENVVSDSDSDEDLRLLLALGSSLVGARPKVSVRGRDGHLAIARFPHEDDEYNSVLWEAVALTLAAKAGITVPDWRVEAAADRPVLILHRFDRTHGMCIPFLSAMSIPGARDNEARSYLEFVDVLRQHGAASKLGMHALWRRIVLSILISNTDDHLRNHGFLYAGPDGWRIAPAYDLNPIPTDIKPRVPATAIDLDDGTASLDLAVEVAEYFELDAEHARTIAAEVRQAVATWRQDAARLGLTQAEIERMASTFEHENLTAATAL